MLRFEQIILIWTKMWIVNGLSCSNKRNSSHSNQSSYNTAVTQIAVVRVATEDTVVTIAAVDPEAADSRNNIKTVTLVK